MMLFVTVNGFDALNDNDAQYSSFHTNLPALTAPMAGSLSLILACDPFFSAYLRP